MQLFRSEWLREPQYVAGRDVPVPGFASRYGVRVERAALPYRPPVCARERVEVPTIERERMVLWDIARYDRAA